jgi:NhaP-type Na+/H+ or K+/H+ antiporter
MPNAALSLPDLAHDASPLLTIAFLLGAGAAVQWISWRLRLPAILFLLLTGFLVGPVLGLFEPERVFGDLFRPLVSLSVGIILFEGGLTLRFDELHGVGRVVRNLCSVGAFVTWVLSTLAGIYIAGVSFEVSLLVGAILVLTGPTVVIPLVRHVRPTPPIGAILRWEGILIDPIGAVLAILVLEVLVGGGTAWSISVGIMRTLVFGGGLGLAAGYLLARALEKFIVPDRLHVPVTFGVVALTFAGANALQSEAGLLSVTVMGIVLANRKKLDIEHVAEWHEPLVTMLLALLFVTIAARLPLSTLTDLGWGVLLYTAALIVVVRPLAVVASTLGSSLRWRERAFLMAMAPRGIVVAAVTAEFSLHLDASRPGDGLVVVGLVFPVIVLSVMFYGFASPPIARLLGVAQRDPQGALIVGADIVSRELARALKEQELDVLLVDTNAANTAVARTSGLRTWHGSVLSTRFTEEAELGGIGNVLAMTPSDEVNRLALEQFLPTFGRAKLFRIDSGAKKKAEDLLIGRRLFREGCTIDELRRHLHAGARIRATKLTDQFGPDDYKAQYGDQAIPLFVLNADDKLQVVTADAPATLRAGCTVLSLVPKGALKEPATNEAAAT